MQHLILVLGERRPFEFADQIRHRRRGRARLHPQDVDDARRKKHSINPTELSGIITVHGPGFYTGLRLAEGFSDVFKFFGVKQYSFYSYEIPLWCGYTSGTWFTKAYRGEYFFYRWTGVKSEKKLVSSKELAGEISNDQFFIHSNGSMDTQSSSLISNPLMTSELLKNNSEKIFKEVLKGPAREPFYFRAPEDEFKANP